MLDILLIIVLILHHKMSPRHARLRMIVLYLEFSCTIRNILLFYHYYY